MLQQAKQPFVLFQREGTKNWSMRYSMGGKQIKKSLGTSDEGEALRMANEIWHEQKYRLKMGLSLQQHAFCDVAEEFIKKVEAEAKRDERSKDHAYYWPPKIRRFFIGYFGEQPIETISPSDLERYLEWRVTYWTTGPGSKIDKIRCEREDGRVFSRPVAHKVAALSTIKGEMGIIRSLFGQAVRWGYCQPIAIPAPQLRRRTDNRRPGFTPQDYQKLYVTSLSRLQEPEAKKLRVKAKDGREWTQTTVQKNILADRTRLHAYIELMANSGMRPTEAKNLKWSNILRFRDCRKKPLEQQDVRLQVRGKGKHGDAVPLLDAIPALHMLWDLFESQVGREPDDEDSVFADGDGKPIKSFRGSLSELLKAAGLEYDYRGVRRTSYSFRHYYISSLIAQGVTVHDVARNTRTSIEMIDKHYAQVSTEQIRDKLRPGQEKW